MLGLWILYGLAVLIGIAVPLTLIVRDRLVDGARMDEAIGQLDQDPKTLGMLSGGPGRMVDAMVTDLVERGLAQADNGKLTLTAETERQVTIPRDDRDDARWNGLRQRVATLAASWRGRRRRAARLGGRGHGRRPRRRRRLLLRLGVGSSPGLPDAEREEDAERADDAEDEMRSRVLRGEPG